MIHCDVMDERDVSVFVVDHEQYARLAHVVYVERLAQIVLLTHAQLGALFRRTIEYLVTWY